MGAIKVFIDTNVLVDFFTERMGDGYAKKVLLAGKTSQYRMCISILTAVNVIYILKKYDITLSYRDIESICSVLGQRTEQWKMARELDEMSDFEDAIQTACAIDNKCGFIISRDRHYLNCPLPVLSPEEFVASVSPQQ